MDHPRGEANLRPQQGLRGPHPSFIPVCNTTDPAEYKAIFRAQEPNKGMKDKTAHACRAAGEHMSCQPDILDPAG
jgi:hypothetical protein